MVGLLALAALDKSPDSCGLTLRITPEVVVAQGGEPIPVVATLRNTGTRTLTLVRPGDGSTEGRRTPIIRWEFDPPRRDRSFGCGNINALQAGEVFTLHPGESVALGPWAAPHAFFRPAPARHRATMTYANEPGRGFGGFLQREHDPEELARLRASDECQVESNDIVISVEPRP
jgi:hypothetical protein